MARKQKPIGYENWTWDEINLGRKLSKAEKRNRRLAQHLGATKDSKGNITPPSAQESPNYYLIFGMLLIIFIIAVVAGS